MKALKQTFDPMKLIAIAIGLILNYKLFTSIEQIVNESGFGYLVFSIVIVMAYNVGLILHTIFTYIKFKNNHE